MHILTIPSEITESVPVFGGAQMEPGKSYLCTNAFAGSVLASPWRSMIGEEMWGLRALLKAMPYEEIPFDPTKDWNDREIWLVRGGGWGDLLMLTPTIRELKRRWPRCIIHVATGEGHRGVFKGLDVIEESIPIELSKIPFSTQVVTFEDWIEGHPAAETTHMAQHFANKFGIDLDGDHQPDFILNDEDVKWAEELFPKTNKKRYGIQYMTSAIYRAYPHMEEVIRLLRDQGEVFLFGAPGQLQMSNEGVEDLVNLTDPKLECTFHRSAAVAATCDCIVSPDSVMVHLASALGVPYVGLYGPIPANLRGSGKEGKGIQGMAPCSPCFFHAERPDQFPAGMPCVKARMCVALAQIDPKQIAETAVRLASPIIQLDDRQFR